MIAISLPLPSIWHLWLNLIEANEHKQSVRLLAKGASSGLGLGSWPTEGRRAVWPTRMHPTGPSLWFRHLASLGGF